jgi:hypothetical protein
MRSRNYVSAVGNSNVIPPAHVMFPQMSVFGIDASTARKATEANTQTHGRQLCTPSVFASEASRTTRWEACSPIGVISAAGSMSDSR